MKAILAQQVNKGKMPRLIRLYRDGEFVKWLVL